MCFTFQWSLTSPPANTGALRRACNIRERLYLHILDTPLNWHPGDLVPTGRFSSVSPGTLSQPNTVGQRTAGSADYVFFLGAPAGSSPAFSDLVPHCFPLSKNCRAPEAGTPPLTIMSPLDMCAPLANPDVKFLFLMPHLGRCGQSTWFSFSRVTML